MTTTNFSTVTSSTTAPVVGPTFAGTTTYSHVFPATEAQLEIWLSSKQSIEANCAYNEIASLRFAGALDSEALKKALQLLIDRHDSLRSTFSNDGLQMRVWRKQELSVEFVDWCDEPDDQVEFHRLNLLQDQACTPFDLENGPLFRAVLQKVNSTTFWLTFAAHHVVLDGWSLSVLVRDLGQLYNEETGAASSLVSVAPSYREYSTAMDRYFKSADAEADKRFWSEQFEDQVPILDLPTSKHRPALRTYFARRYDHHINAQVVKSLRKLGGKSGCSIFNTMLTAFNVFVARISNCHDFCVGVPTAGQMAMDQPDLIGHCVNTMPLRVQIDTDKSFTDQLKVTRSQMLDAFEHQRYSFGKILTDVAPPRDPSRPPMVAISFNLDPSIDSNEIGFEGLGVEVQIEPRLFENFEWFVNGVIQDDQSVELQIQYNTDLFSADLMQQLMTGFEEFLGHLVSQSDALLGELPILSIAQRQKMLVAWNDSAREFKATNTLHQEFMRQAQATPDKVAVRFENRKYTYAELNTQSNQFARYLRQANVGAGDLVGVCVPRDETMMVVLFGILKAGAGYVPLDPEFPGDRLQYMCDHSQLKLVVCTESVEPIANEFSIPSIVFEKAKSEFEQLSSEPLEIEVQAKSTCYVIYTSGSTGKPKGVQIPHGAVVNFLHSMAEQPGFGADDSVLAVTTLSFDIAVLELFLPLVVGGTSVIASKAVASDGQKIVDAIDQYEITMFQSTPASLRLMIASGWEGSHDLKVLCGGEPMPKDLVDPLLKRCDQLWNMYGPTETTVWSSVFRINDTNSPIMIGKPIANTQIYILDKNLQPVPTGADGEIYIGGAGVTLGYLHQEQMTRKRFVENPYFNPFANYCNHRLYRTGDLGRFWPDGNIQFLRRNDKQVKVRGFRIELGEIESALKSHTAIRQAVAIVREDVPGDTRLVAYWVAEPNSETTANDLRESLRSTLPYYMVPQHLVELDSLPQTNNGKIDYQSLPVPTATNEASASDLRHPETAIERFIAGVWREILNIEDIYINDNFFDLGGHSMLVMQAIKAIEDKTGARLTPPEFLIGTLEQLAERVNELADVINGELEPMDAVDATPVESSRSSELKTAANPDEQPAQASAKSLFQRITGFWD